MITIRTIRKLLAGLVLAGFVGASGAVFADTAAVKCVQRELNALGFDAGPTDGLVGVRTFLAGEDYIRFMRANAERGWAQPSLSDRNARHWCEKVAEAHPKIAYYWRAVNQAKLPADPEAIFQMAWQADTGEGMEQDERLAVRWYHRAADLGYAPAQRNLGGMYGSGRGTARDDDKAQYWFTLAAMQGDAQAQYVLGKFYSPADPVALSWLWKAAHQGHVEAIEELERRLAI